MDDKEFMSNYRATGLRVKAHKGITKKIQPDMKFYTFQLAVNHGGVGSVTLITSEDSVRGLRDYLLRKMPLEQYPVSA